MSLLPISIITDISHTKITAVSISIFFAAELLCRREAEDVLVQAEGAGIHQNCSVSDKSIKRGTNVYWTMLIIFRNGVKKNSFPLSNGCYGHILP